MEDVGDQPASVIPATLDHEMLLIRGAITMVATGAAPRVVLVGIPFGETLLDSSRRLAIDAGVRLVQLRRSDEAGADLAVERIPT